MRDTHETERIQHDPAKTLQLGSEHDFWLNEEDDVYDELYREPKEPNTQPQTDTKTGRCVSG